MQTKNDYQLILLRANIRKKKDKRTFVLTETNTYPNVSLNEGLYLMSRCGFPLYAQEGLNQASFTSEDVGCYEKNDNEIIIAVLQQKRKYPYGYEPGNESIELWPEEPESIHLCNLSGSRLNKLIEHIINIIDNGKRLKETFVKKALQEARLSIIPKGWEVVAQGVVEPGERYLEEDRATCLTITPALISWTSCNVSFSPHKPGSPVKRYPWDDSIIIRMSKNK